MEDYLRLLDAFTAESKHILGAHLTGVYLHGSAAMGCFNPRKSDLDLLVVIKDKIPNSIKRLYMDMAVRLNALAPEKGIEFSIIREDVCRPFVYPTPFELHFSISHLAWYCSNPTDYINKMRGTDPDLAAHVTILYHRGKTLCGKDIKTVFSEVRPEDYWDSIVRDVENAAADILKAPVYVILNLCRVLAYKRDGLILSKSEGGEWGLANLPALYADLIRVAVTEYRSSLPAGWDKKPLHNFAAYMLALIYA